MCLIGIPKEVKNNASWKLIFKENTETKVAQSHDAGFYLRDIYRICQKSNPEFFIFFSHE